MEFWINIPIPIQFLAVMMLGLALGSFSNVCIYRLPNKESVVFPASHCTACNAPVRAWDNIPVISFLILGGKCRACGDRISRIYPLVELATAFLLVTGYAKFGLSWKFAIFLVLAPTLIIITVIDINHKIIPDVITLPGIVFGLVAGTYLVGFWNSVLGLLVGGGLFYLIADLYFRLRGDIGMGGGDIKYIAAAGALLGWKQVLLVIFIGAFLGAIVGLAGMADKKLGSLSQIPFGPFLAAGTLITFFYGKELIYLYWTTLGGGY